MDHERKKNLFPPESLLAVSLFFCVLRTFGGFCATDAFRGPTKTLDGKKTEAAFLFRRESSYENTVKDSEANSPFKVDSTLCMQWLAGGPLCLGGGGKKETRSHHKVPSCFCGWGQRMRLESGFRIEFFDITTTARSWSKLSCYCGLSVQPGDWK